MTKLLQKIFGASKDPAEKKRDDFSRFFLEASSREKTKVIRRVLREATKEQQELLDRYREQEAMKA